MINVFHDITEERGAEARLRFLAEASTLLSASLDYEATLADLARAARPADRRLLHRRRARRGRADPAPGRDLPPRPEREELLRELRRRYPPEANEAHPVSAGPAQRRAVPRRGRPRRRARPTRRSTRSISRSTRRSTRSRTSSSRSRHAAGCSGRSRSAPASRAAGSASPISSSRTRSRGAPRSRSTTRSSSGPPRSRTPSSTRCSSRRRSGSASGIATSASSA